MQSANHQSFAHPGGTMNLGYDNGEGTQGHYV